MSYVIEASASADDHLTITDALLRFGVGTDDGDAAMLASAFAAQAVVDFGPCSRKLDLKLEPLRGRDAIVGFLVGTSTLQATSHVVSNARARMADGRDIMRAFPWPGRSQQTVARGDRDRKADRLRRPGYPHLLGT